MPNERPDGAGHRAAELGHPAAASGQGLGHPAPADVVQQRLLDEVVLEGRPDEHDGPERALPLLDPVGVVQQDEPAGRGIRLGVGHLGGQGDGGRGQALGRRGLVDLELRAARQPPSAARERARRRRCRRQSTSRPQARRGTCARRRSRRAAPRVARMAALLALSSSLMWGTADFLGGFTSRRIPALAVYGLSQAVGFVVLVLAATVTASWGADPGLLALGDRLQPARHGRHARLLRGPVDRADGHRVAPGRAVGARARVASACSGGRSPAASRSSGSSPRSSASCWPADPELSGAESAQAADPRRRRGPRVRRHVPDDGRGQRLLAPHDDDRHAGDHRGPLRRHPARRCATSAGRSARDALPLAAIGVFDAGANVAYGVATTLGLLATTAVLGSLYPVVTAVLAAIVLHERLARGAVRRRGRGHGRRRDDQRGRLGAPASAAPSVIEIELMQ